MRASSIVWFTKKKAPAPATLMISWSKSTNQKPSHKLINYVVHVCRVLVSVDLPISVRPVDDYFAVSQNLKTTMTVWWPCDIPKITVSALSFLMVCQSIVPPACCAKHTQILGQRANVDSWFNLMKVNEVPWNETEEVSSFTVIKKWLKKLRLGLVLLEDLHVPGLVQDDHVLQWMFSEPDLYQIILLFHLRLVWERFIRPAGQTANLGAELRLLFVWIPSVSMRSLLVV